jgi:methylphosphotriester-DNA--protein-cysteine methyltransferase
MADITDTALTVPQVATELSMTPAGVYKLIQRGKLDAERVSERKTTVRRSALDGFIETQRARVVARRDATPQLDPADLRLRFEKATGCTPEQWLEKWKADQLDDTPENMTLLIRAVALRAHAGVAPIEQPAEHAWALAAFTDQRQAR